MSRQITAMFYVEGDTDREAYETFCDTLAKLGDAPVAARDFITLAIDDDDAAQRAFDADRPERLLAVWRAQDAEEADGAR